MGVISKQITYCGKSCLLACDGNCRKAWGINSRPRVILSESDPDDYAFLADGELGDAPECPGTYEGSCRKPLSDSERLNKWCARECERSAIMGDTKWALPDLSVRLFNIPRRP